MLPNPKMETGLATGAVMPKAHGLPLSVASTTGPGKTTKLVVPTGPLELMLRARLVSKMNAKVKSKDKPMLMLMLKERLVSTVKSMAVLAQMVILMLEKLRMTMKAMPTPKEKLKMMLMLKVILTLKLVLMLMPEPMLELMLKPMPKVISTSIPTPLNTIYFPLNINTQHFYIIL